MKKIDPTLRLKLKQVTVRVLGDGALAAVRAGGPGHTGEETECLGVPSDDPAGCFRASSPYCEPETL